MNRFAQRMLVVVGVALGSLAGCGKKSNCPTYWAEPDNQQKASDGKKSAGENLDNSKEEKREIELSVVRVKRDKNGIVEKKQPKKPKKRAY
jgi:predicted small lipoprotein YifL